MQLDVASREKVEKVLIAIRALLNWIRAEFLGNEMAYDFQIIPLDDEVRVLEVLFDGLQVEAKDKAALTEALEEKNIQNYEAPAPKPDWLTKRP